MSGSTRELVYRMSVAGKGEVLAAFATINQAAKRMATEEARVVEASEAHKRKSRRATAADAKSVDAERIRAAAATTAAEQKESYARSRFAEKMTLEQVKAANKAADKTIAAAARVTAAHRKFNERTAREADAVEEAAVRKSLRRSANQARDRVEIVRREAKEREDIERKAQRASERAHRDAMFDRKRLFRSLGTGVAEGMITLGGFGVGVAKRAASGIARGTGVDKAFDVADIVGERMRVDRMLDRIAVETRAPGEMTTFDKKKGRASIARAASDTGFSQTELVDALDAATEKGKSGELFGALGRVAVEARAISASPADVMRFRAQALVSAGSTGQKLNEDDLQRMIAQTSYLGKIGVFRADAIAEQAGPIFSRMASAGVDFKKGFAREIALAQIAAESTGGHAQAKTAFDSIHDSIAKNEAKLEGHGVRVTDHATGARRDMTDIIEDIIVHGHGKTSEMKAMGIGDVRAMAAFASLQSAFNGAGGGEKGRAAMDAFLASKMGAVANIGAGDVTADAAEMMKGEGVKIAKAMEEIRTSLGDAIAPAIHALAVKMPDIVSVIGQALEGGKKFLKEHPDLAAIPGDVADWALKHPKTAAGAGAFIASGLPTTIARWGVGGAARWMGDRLAGGAGSAFGATLASAAGGVGATSVYVTGVAPGVSLGGFPGGAVASVVELGPIAMAAILALGIGMGVEQFADDEVSGEGNESFHQKQTGEADERVAGAIMSNWEASHEEQPSAKDLGDQLLHDLDALPGMKPKAAAKGDEAPGDWFGGMRDSRRANADTSPLAKTHEEAATAAGHLTRKINITIDALSHFVRALDAGGSKIKATPH